MRLIDADKIEYEVAMANDNGMHSIVEYAEYENIQDMPTVEAIPIEWLKEWFKKRYKGRTYRDLIEEWESEQFWEKQNETR